MEIKFQTKDESNKLQKEHYLKLTPAEKIIYCFHIINSTRVFPTKNKTTISDFEKVINIKRNLDIS